MATGDPFQTLLVLSDMGFPIYSAGGIRQTLTPIGGAGNILRDINGELVDLSDTAFQKFASRIECTDQNSPGIDGIWPGKILTVDCVVELAYSTNTGSPARPPVEGSTWTSGDFTVYRPRLLMMVKNYELSLDEWPSDVSWSMDLEEVTLEGVTGSV